MKRGDKKGFTIIEVSLVLAIAGLIFLMIFIALPALRRTQRDSARREDMMSFLKELKNFQTNNRGALPTGGDDAVVNYTWGTSAVSNAAESSWAGFFRDYLGDKFVDPDGVHYNLTVTKCGVSSVDTDCSTVNKNSFFRDLGTAGFRDYKIIVVKQATCLGEKAVGVANPRKVAVLYRLEGAGTYCGNT